MSGEHARFCPCGFLYVPDAHGWNCTGGAHRLNRAGETPMEEARRIHRDRERRREQDRQRAADIQRQRERERERERERQKQKDKEAQRERERVREEQKQRQEALARVRGTLDAPLATTRTEIRTETRVETRAQENVPAMPVDEMDETPFQLPWLQTPAAPPARQREPEFVSAARPRRQEREKMPWEE